MTYNPTNMETKDFPLEVKAISDSGVIEGYASVFGNIDLGGDVVAPGAFTDSLKKAKAEGFVVKMLWHHDPKQPIGVWDELVEDSKGLHGKGRLVMEVERAREIHALAKAGAVGGLSIGYRTTKSSPHKGAVLLEQLELFEVSPVTFPMNVSATMTAVKAAGIEEIVEKLGAGDRLTEREFERMAKGLGLSNSQAERAARVHLKGQGEPADAAAKKAQAFLMALRG